MARKKSAKNASSIYPVSEVYRDMLADANSSPMQSDEDGRLVKKRRVAGRLVTNAQYPSNQAKSEPQEASIDDLFDECVPVQGRQQQQIIKSESEDSTDSDVNWEEVDLKDVLDREESPESEPRSRDMNLILGDDKQRTSRVERRKGKTVTAAERKLRLEVHKMHLCCLLIHVHIRNFWCNDEDVHVSR